MSGRTSERKGLVVTAMQCSMKQMRRLITLAVCSCLISNSAAAAAPRSRAVSINLTTKINIVATPLKLGRTKLSCYLGPKFSQAAFVGAVKRKNRRQILEEIASGKVGSVQYRRWRTFTRYCQVLATQRDTARASSSSTLSSSSSSSQGELIGGSSSSTDQSSSQSEGGSSSSSVVPTPECEDGIDNDGDGLIDAPLDAGCESPTDDSEAGDEAARKPFRVYSWDSAPAQATHILPWKWAASARLDRAALTAREVNSMPVGHRVLMLWDLDEPLSNGFEFTNDPADYSTDPVTGRRYQALWWDSGVARLRAQINGFFDAFKAAGGELDYHVIDNEEFYFGAWGIFQCDSPPLFRIPCAEVENRLRAIEHDPRYQNEILPRLRSLGFPTTGTLSEILRTRTNWNSLGDPVLIWDAVMNERVAAYYRQAFVEPTLRAFPQAKISNYLWNVQPSQFQIPDPNGNRYYLYDQGAVVGTHHAPSLYGYINYLSLHKLDGVNLYAATPFNALRYDLNIMRSNILSAVGQGVSPWVSFRSFGHLFRNNDFYQELIMHLQLSGAEQLLLWNPGANHTPVSTDADEQLVERATAETEHLAGFEDRQVGFSGLIPWGDEYVMTCMVAQARNICRFTPKPEYGAPEQLLQQTAAGVTVRLGQQTLNFPGAVVYHEAAPASPLGVWLVSPIAQPR